MTGNNIWIDLRKEEETKDGKIYYDGHDIDIDNYILKTTLP